MGTRLASLAKGSIMVRWSIVLKKTDDGNISVRYFNLCHSFKTTGFNGSRKWIDVGCQSFRIDKVKEHKGSAQHRHSFLQSLSNTVDSMADKITTEIQTANSKCNEMSTVCNYWKSTLSIFNGLTDLCIEVESWPLSKLRLAENATYILKLGYSTRTAWSPSGEMKKITSMCKSLFQCNDRWGVWHNSWKTLGSMC